jgi:hypothetical protein
LSIWAIIVRLGEKIMSEYYFGKLEKIKLNMNELSKTFAASVSPGDVFVIGIAPGDIFVVMVAPSPVSILPASVVGVVFAPVGVVALPSSPAPVGVVALPSSPAPVGVAVPSVAVVVVPGYDPS